MSLIPKKGTIYVVDDDEGVRDSLQWLLEGKDYRVRCFDSAETFLSRYDAREVACLIVDIRMGGMSGLELQDRLIERKSPLPIVFITGHGDVPMAVEAMRAGAVDFLQKPFKDDDLIRRVQKALAQDERLREQLSGLEQIRLRHDSLTPREREIASRLVAGNANKVIAIDLGLSERTVEVHRAHIMQKMEARGLAQLVQLLLRLQPG